MFEADRLFEQVSSLKRNRGFVANSFLSAHDLERISQEERSFFVHNDRAALVVNDDSGINRAYFYLADMEDIAELISLSQLISHRPLVIDCIGNGQRVSNLSEALRAIGFMKIAELSRWKSGSILFFSYPHFFDDSFAVATEKDSNPILNILCKTFDPLISHLPSKAKLLELIAGKMVFCAKSKNQIVAVVCLDKLGQKSIYLYQDAVVEEYRSTGIGILLLQFALYHYKDYSHFVSWSEDKNHASNRMHKALGMAYDGLKDHVLIFK